MRQNASFAEYLCSGGARSTTFPPYH